MVYNTVNRKWKGGSTSEKQCSLYYRIRPFTRQFFDAISSVKLMQQNTHTYFPTKNFYDVLTTHMPFILHSNLHKWSSIAVPGKQFHKLKQPLRELRTLHKAGTNKYAWIRSF